MANPFDTNGVDVLKALMAGEQSYDKMRGYGKENRMNDARAAAGLALQNGGDTRSALAQLFGAGDIQGATVLGTLGKADTTDEIKEYNLSKSQGDTRSFTDWKTGLKLAGATRINNSVNTGEKSYDSTLGKNNAENFVEVQKAGRNAVGALGNLGLMENLLQDPNFYSGAGGPAITKAKQIAASLGIADANSAAPNELFQKIASKSVLDASGGSLGAGFSNADRDFLQGTVANIANTPEGNKQIIQVAKAVEKRKLDVAKLARDYAKNNSGRIDAGFDDTLAQYAEKNPLFPSNPRTASPAGGQQQSPVPGARQGNDGQFYLPDPNRPGKYLRVVP